MSVSTDGIICYGIFIEDDGDEYDFPWNNREFDHDIEQWWIYKIHGYKNPIVLFDINGSYINGLAPSREDRQLYYDSRRDFSKSHPIPIELVYTCSDGYTEYIIAVPGTVITASRGDSQIFNPKDLVVTDEQRSKLIEFCNHYIDNNMSYEPNWYLSNYWG